MEQFHREILGLLKKHIDVNRISNQPKGYMGNNHASFGIPVPIARRIAKQWAREHQQFSQITYEALLLSLAKGATEDEKYFVGRLLEYMPIQRQEIDLSVVDKLLDHMEGWGEVDTICQSAFSPEEFLTHWGKWSAFLKKLSTDDNINKKRASLVLLTRPVSYSEDTRLSDLSFFLIDRLKVEKSILITKAISWLLRSLIRHHKTEVQNYINENESTLPKIALRETKRKLETGKK